MEWWELCPYQKHLGLPWREVLQADRHYVERMARGVGGGQIPQAMLSFIKKLLGWEQGERDVQRTQ